MKKRFFILCLFLIFTYTNTYVYADGIDDAFDAERKNQINESFENAEIDLNPIEIIEKLNSGDFNIEYENIFQYLKIKLTETFKDDFSFLINIFLLVIISSLVESLQSAFKNDKTVNLVVTGIVVLSTINLTYSVAEFCTQMIDRLIMFINSLIPTLMSFLASSGKIGTSGILNPIMLGVSSVISLVIKSFVIPLGIIGLCLRLTGDITDKKHLNNFGNQIYKLLKIFLGLIFSIYVSIISIVGVSAPKIDEITLKTTKYAVGNFIPYVGGMLADSVDLILNCSSVVKNSVGIAGLIGIVSIVAVPCIRMTVKLILINILSFTVSPVAGKSILNSINNISSYLGILLSMMVVVSVMYILSVTVIIFIGGA